MLHVLHGPGDLPRSSCNFGLCDPSLAWHHSLMCHLPSHFNICHELFLLLQNRVLQNEKSYVCYLCKKDSSSSFSGRTYLITMGILRLRCSFSDYWFRLRQTKRTLPKTKQISSLQNNINGNSLHVNNILHRRKTCHELFIVTSCSHYLYFCDGHQSFYFHLCGDPYFHKREIFSQQ